MRILEMRWPACLASVPCLLLAACGGGGGGSSGGGVAPPSLDVTPSLAGPATVTPGAAYDYGVTLAANGGTAQSVGATLTLPASVVITAVTGGGTANGAVITWPAIASLAAGTPVNHTVSVIAPSVGPLNATLAVTTSSVESNTGNNSVARRTVLGFDALATLAGEAAGDGFGFVMDGLPDLDGDGVADFIVGAPGHDGGGDGSGRAYVYSGAGAALLFTVSGQAAGENLGWAVAAAGDVDADGTGDFIVGAPSTGAGSARVYSGASGALLQALSGPGAGARFGVMVAGIGDVDGDGHADLLVTADRAGGGSGQAFVVSGMTGATLRSHTRAGGSQYGYGAGAVGDVSGDAVPDYAIGGDQGTGGYVEVRSGADGGLLYTVSPLATSGQLGFGWIDAVGDLDGDGRPDFFVADINDSGNRGRGLIVSGATGTVIRTLPGTVANEFFGIARHGGADADGDGVPDVFIAGYHNGEGAALGGKAYVYSGANGTLLRTMTSTIANETLGYDAVQLGDVDADGLVEYLLSGDIEQGSTGRGRVYLIRGTPLP